MEAAGIRSCLVFLILGACCFGEATPDNENLQKIKVCYDDVCHPTDEYSINNTKNHELQCPEQSKLNGLLYPICGLDEPANTSNEVCVEGESEQWDWDEQCKVSLPTPCLCNILGYNTTCASFLKSLQVSAVGGLSTFSVMAVTRSGILRIGSTISTQDIPLALQGSIMVNVFLLKDLVAGAISVFILSINFLVHMDGRRYLRKREMRARFRKLAVHITDIIIQSVSLVLILTDLLVFAIHHIIAFLGLPLVAIFYTFHFVKKILVGTAMFILRRRSRMPCCPVDQRRRPYSVTDNATSCDCNPHFPKRSNTVDHTTATSQNVYE